MAVNNNSNLQSHEYNTLNIQIKATRMKIIASAHHTPGVSGSLSENKHNCQSCVFYTPIYVTENKRIVF